VGREARDIPYSPSSPPPAARRSAASGLDRSARPSKSASVPTCAPAPRLAGTILLRRRYNFAPTLTPAAAPKRNARKASPCPYRIRLRISIAENFIEERLSLALGSLSMGIRREAQSPFSAGAYLRHEMATAATAPALSMFDRRSLATSRAVAEHVDRRYQ
jgi:hypothetical protein